MSEIGFIGLGLMGASFAVKRFSAIARLVTSMAFALYCGVAASAEPVRVAFFGSLSGPFALQGEETLKNLQAAADFVNARGGALDGRKLEIVPFDNKGNPQESLIVLKQAIDRDIRFVVSGVSNVAHALSDALEKHKMDYLPVFRAMEMLASALKKAGTDDPLKVAYAMQRPPAQ